MIGHSPHDVLFSEGTHGLAGTPSLDCKRPPDETFVRKLPYYGKKAQR
jgi:hypothetical protein